MIEDADVVEASVKWFCETILMHAFAIDVGASSARGDISRGRSFTGEPVCSVTASSSWRRLDGLSLR
jgi:hypothetical protein